MFIENVGRAHWHHLDKTQNQVALSGEFYQWDQLIVVSATHQNGVQFDLIKACADRGVDPPDNLVKKIPAGDVRINFSVQRVERNINRLHARMPQGSPLSRPTRFRVQAASRSW